MLLQGFTVLADDMVQTEVKFIKGQSLLGIGCCLSSRVVVSLLREGKREP